MSQIRIVPVVIGILHNDNQQFFIAKRPPQVVMPGFWEFPGGKIEPAESQIHALQREFQEEVGIQVESATFLKTFDHHFSELSLALHVWQIQRYTGEACGNEGQEVRWVSRAQLHDFVFMPSNEHLLTFLHQRFNHYD